MQTLIHCALLLLLPLPLLGLIGKVKAWCAGRAGAPLLQPLHDVVKLLRKGAVYSTTTSWLFAAGPIIALASALVAGLLVPLADSVVPIAFFGDIFVFAALLGLGRFFTMTAALDTGSAFEGMGASREAAFAALTEPALLLCLLIVGLPARCASFASAFSALHGDGAIANPVLVLAALAFGVVLLAETARVPVDDPNTHLELTMIHEVMVLDHSGPDLAFILYGYALKLFVLGAVLVHIALPIRFDGSWTAIAIFVAAQAAVSVVIGLIESTMARLRLPRVPQLLIGATVMAALGLAVMLSVGRP